MDFIYYQEPKRKKYASASEIRNALLPYKNNREFLELLAIDYCDLLSDNIETKNTGQDIIDYITIYEPLNGKGKLTLLELGIVIGQFLEIIQQREYQRDRINKIYKDRRTQ